MIFPSQQVTIAYLIGLVLLFIIQIPITIKIKIIYSQTKHIQIIITDLQRQRMGVLKLMNFIQSKCPQIISHRSPLHYKNKRLAIDSPSAIYKFLVKTITSTNSKINIPMDSKGNQTGHLIGIMYRALLCIQVGIKPIWVFDGTPPSQKLTELKRRKNLKEQAQTKSQEALQLGDLIQAAKQSKRSVRISRVQVQDTITMLTLMGMPTVRSYGQAEAQCAWLVKNQLADGVISEDLDTLAFGSNLLIRGFARDKAALQIPRQMLLQKIGLDQNQFIDFCILCGCDYTPKILNIGPVKGYKFIKQQKSLQGVIKKIVNDQKLRKKHQITDQFNYLRARELFKNPSVNQDITKEQLQLKQINYSGLKDFLIEKEFSEARIQRWIDVAKGFRQKVQIAK